MGNNFKYFNALFIIMISITLIGIFKYFFYENKEKNRFNHNIHKKKLNKNYIDHIVYIPDNYYFLEVKRIEGYDEYNLLINKLFKIISETIKYNISVISINLISLTDLALMNNATIQNLINNKKLWKLIEKYAKKMNLKINFIYDNSIINKDLASIFEHLKSVTNNQKSYTQVNFIVGYDLFNNLKNNFINLVSSSKNKEELLIRIKSMNMETYLLNKIPPIDLAIIFDNGYINDNLLLHMTHCKIVNLNYSLDKITKKVINIFLKEFLFNKHPFI